MKPTVFFNQKKNIKKPEKLIAREVNNVSHINFWNNKHSCDLFLPELCQFFARKLGSFIYLFVYLFVCWFVSLFIYLFIYSFSYLFNYLFIIFLGGKGWVATKATIKICFLKQLLLSYKQNYKSLQLYYKKTLK